MRECLVSSSWVVSVFFLFVAGCQPVEEKPTEETPPAGGDSSSDPPPSPPLTEDGKDVLKPLPSAKATMVTSGRLHACALTEGGEVRCWGYSDHAQIRSSDETGAIGHSYPIPVLIDGLATGVKMVAAASGSDHTCVITASGGVKCWGDDSVGQLGTGVPYTDNRKHESAKPVDVKDLSANVLSISVGDVSSCALLADRSVKCWGQNGCWIGDGNDHLGGDTATPPSATAVDTGLKDITQVSVGHEHACALTTAGTVKCWGTNTWGQIGIGDERARVTVPTDVPGLTDVTSISAGFRTTCARLMSGAVKCWGTREYGSIGDGKKDTFDSARSPVGVVGMSSGAIDVFTGLGFSCAIVGGSKNVKCWGDSSALGTAEGDSYRTYQPAGNVVGLENVTKVVGGSAFACALLQDGAVKCWGTNGGGMLGDGKGGVTGDEGSHAPVGVVSLP